MSTMPGTLKAAEVIRILQRLGFAEVRQRGSHRQFEHPDSRRTTVPDHGSRELKRGTFRTIVRSTRLSLQDFLDMR